MTKQLDELRVRLAALSREESIKLLDKLSNLAWCGVASCDQPDAVQCSDCPHFIPPSETEEKKP